MSSGKPFRSSPLHLSRSACRKAHDPSHASTRPHAPAPCEAPSAPPILSEHAEWDDDLDDLDSPHGRHPAFLCVARLISVGIGTDAPRELNVTSTSGKAEVSRCRKRCGEIDALNLLQRMEKDGGNALLGDTDASATLEHLKAFCAQTQRQAAGLSSNTRKQETKAGAEALIKGHEAGVRRIIREASSSSAALTLDSLLAVHRAVVQGGVQKPNVRPGELRTTEVRVGNARCLPAALVPWACAKVIQAIDVVAGRSDVDLFGKAAFGLVALVAAHPFADGNGRVARLAMNFLLLKHRLPFVICLCPTPELRSRQNEIVVALASSAF